MMKKIIIILTIFLLTGCNVDYTITLNKDNLDELADIYMDKDSYFEMSSQDIINEVSYLEETFGFYKKEDLRVSLDKIGRRYTYTGDYDSFSYDSYASMCYESINITADNGITIKTSDEFLCYNYYPLLENITLKVKSKYKVISSNADYEENNTLVWKITKDNYKNKPIKIELSNQKVKASSLPYLLISLAAFVIVLVIYLYLRIRRANQN